MSDYTAYIDEAGDLGINRGTQWFVLTAVLVKKEAEAQIRHRMSGIKAKLNIKEIHFRTITDFKKRGFIVRELKDQDFIYMSALVDTNKFDASKIPDTHVAYNFICKYLLQRVSWFLNAQGKTCDVVLSARGTARDGELIEYIQGKLLPYDYNSIYSSAFEKISAKPAASWDMLQLADVCATTMFLTYEINSYGFSTPCFSIALADHLYRKDGKLDSYGVKFFTRDMKPDKEALQATRVCSGCIKQERTPGATST